MRPIPLVTIDWDTVVIRRVGSDPMSMPRQKLRNSKAPRAGYSQLRDAMLNGLLAPEAPADATGGYGAHACVNSAFPKT